jgi:hypothetical protein
MMGLQNLSYNLSWFAFFSCFILIVSIEGSIIIFLGVLKMTPIYVVFLILMTYGLATFSFVLFLS